MLVDEREETLREVCALGNVKAVQQFLNAGVNLNSQNRMNGWTALHWASHRGQVEIVRFLLSHGADANLKTNKGQTALDLCAKFPEIQTMLEAQCTEHTGAGAEPELRITPTYLKEPDLEKSWLLPDEFSENKVERVVRTATAKERLENEANGITPDVQPSPSPASSEQGKERGTKIRETIVYLGTKSDDTILGAVYLRNEPMDVIVTRLKEVQNGKKKKKSRRMGH
ncbi:ankyrin repeat-containing domain protein [Gongronella butleri]|nr:ankyrin repeat-containing domain protein [Gongronella butleri]